MLASDLAQILASKKPDFPPEQLSKATHAAAACQAGIPRVHIINGRVDEGLLAEVFSNEGIGTLIYANEYQQVRRAMKKDVRSIMHLTKDSVAAEELTKRTRVAIEKQLNDYYIFEIDKNPVACVALHVYPEQNKGELACLYVSPSHENQGIGRKLIQFVESKAREMGRSEEHTSELQSPCNLVCRLLLEKKKRSKSRRSVAATEGGRSSPLPTARARRNARSPPPASHRPTRSPTPRAAVLRPPSISTSHT